jgi:hypothetical protein
MQIKLGPTEDSWLAGHFTKLASLSGQADGADDAEALPSFPWQIMEKNAFASR